MPDEKIALATTNSGKIKEIQSMLCDLPLTLVSQSRYNIPHVKETGLSFIENAIIKARHVAKHTLLPAIADDSGLVVTALKGAPGIYSARYAGESASDQDNINKLLQHLAGVPDTQRQAHFYCVIALLKDPEDPAPMICQSHWEGYIAHTPQGKHGFGYDPIFYVSEYQCTAAQLTPEIKNRISHRGKSLQQLKIKLTAWLS